MILGHELTRQNRVILIGLIAGSIVLLLIIIIGAPFYYYKYGRGDTKASISKNPNYGSLVFRIWLTFEKQDSFRIVHTRSMGDR